MKIQIIGQIFGTSGYSIHTRSLANALSQYAEVKLIAQVPQGMESELTDKEIQMLKQTWNPDVNIIIDLPCNWKANIESKCKNIGFLVWEGDRIPKSFINEINNKDIDKVFVPSNHTKDAILNSIKLGKEFDNLNKEIYIVPHGVDLNIFFPTQKPDKFKFILNKGFRNLLDRGGTQFAVKAFIEEFNPDEAEMIIKINPAYTTDKIMQLFDELGAIKGRHKIGLIHDNLPTNQMYKIYNLGHVFVAPSMAEGYHLGCIEAMACGLPVITTNFGGQIDYVNKENGWIVGGELIEVKHELIYEGIKWLKPDLDELKNEMRKAYNLYNKTEEFKKKIEKAIETAKNNTWDKTAKLIIDILDDNKTTSHP